MFHKGRRLGDARVTLLARPNGLEFSRLGVAVSGDHGGAVRRNRIKRLCREAMRLSLPELPAGWDFMVVPRKGAELSLPALRESLLGLAKRLAAQPPGEEHRP